jgi:hypothetical protein
MHVPSRRSGLALAVILLTSLLPGVPAGATNLDDTKSLDATDSSFASALVVHAVTMVAGRTDRIVLTRSGE